jgi:iron(III) transport system ATP-binding protein
VATAGQLVLRPEALRMMRVDEAAAGGSANLLPARVARRQYLGAKTSYRLTLSGGQELQVEDAGMASYEVGDSVQLRVPADSRVVAA